jgi:outer membrane protein OmpA-like peptidoglycan-associated protein
MKNIVSIILFISFPVLLIGQNLKLQLAERYFEAYRFQEATIIYEELFTEGKLPLPNYEKSIRNGIESAIKSRSYHFAYTLLTQLESDSSFNSTDFYQLFNLTLILQKQNETLRLLSSPLLKNFDKSTQRFYSNYKNGELFKTLLKDTNSYKINLSTFNSGKGDFSPNFHPKGILFSSARENTVSKWSYDQSSFLNIYLLDTNTNIVSKLKFLSSQKHDGTACYDSINQIWYFARNLEATKTKPFGTTGLFIYDEKSQTEKAFSFNSHQYFIAHPQLSENGKTLWFASNKPGGYGESDIWYCTKTETGWSEPMNAGGKINTLKNEMFPFENKGVLYFSSDGNPGLGGLDIYSNEINQFKFGVSKNMGGNLNSHADDFGLILDKNGQNGYFSSNRTDFIDRIYELNIKIPTFTLKAKLKTDFPIQVDLNKIPIIIKKNGEIVDTIFASDQNEIQFKGEKNTNYTFEIKHPEVQNFSYTYSTIDKKDGEITNADFQLESKYITVTTQVIDEKTKAIIPNSKIKYLNPETGKTETFITSESGEIKTKMLRDKTFKIEVSHAGYLDNQIVLMTDKKVENINQNISLTLIMKGTTFAIENIFYDYGKSNLREESKVELDKLVEFLSANPGIKIELSAHTDSRGSDAQNLKLSQARAQSCVDYLISQGISKQRIVAKGYGETKLVNRCKNGMNCSEEEHQQNRRTEIKILSVE